MSEPDFPVLDPTRVRWSQHPSPDRALVVLLHGYGSHEGDLFGLVPFLPAEAVYAAPRAPLTPPWPAPGASWYPIEGLDGRDPQKVTDAAQALLDWLDAEAPGVPTGLLGFSQGGAVSLQALRLAPERFRFAVNLSGYATPGELAGDAQLAQRTPPVFWGRGTHDEVIPEFLIEHTVQWLPTHAELSGRVYPGLGHSVSQDELDDVAAFVAARLPD